MRHKTVETEPYIHTYCAFNKHTGDTYGDFDCLIEAIVFAETQPRRHPRQTALSYTRKRESDQLYENVDYVYDFHSGKRWWESRRRIVLESYFYPAPDWLIVNDLGEAVEKSEIGAARRSTWRGRNRNWEARQALKGARLTRKKGSGDKVKATCEQVPYIDTLGDLDYSNLVRGYYRGISTTHEARWNEAHTNEYGPGLVRAARSKRNLPNAWDDIYSGMYKTEDNWKHHSKRRKQWKPK